MSEMEQLQFKIILHAGQAKNEAMEAVDLAMNGRIEEAEAKLVTARTELAAAHSLHKELLGQEARGELQLPPSLLLVHAENHLMSGVTELQLSNTIVKLCGKLVAKGSL
ncbi:PTS lactose/cellobiose transporter subunit IIA [Effusibacillus consociatus]|uniref:PTS lactose/cellobiose transporter subunit IIA n=1 Tax=Effusibacillus consociatus TaxID=1117041 RepID=A0ABV9Q2C3_9BACL